MLDDGGLPGSAQERRTKGEEGMADSPLPLFPSALSGPLVGNVPTSRRVRFYGRGGPERSEYATLRQVFRRM